MTTVVLDLYQGVMVADSSISDDNIKTTVSKIFKTRKAIIGVAGDWSHANAFVSYYNDRRRKMPRNEGCEWEAMIWTPRGAYYIDHTLVQLDIAEPYMAIGSGAAAALGALRAGCTAPEAVGIACGIDPFSGFPVVTELLALKGKR